MNRGRKNRTDHPSSADTERFHRKSRWRVAAICVALALIIWLVFGQCLQHVFVNYDDNLYVYENPIVLGGLTSQGIAWAFTHTYAGNWHPLTWLSHMLDVELYGLNPGGHHSTSVLLHGASTVLLFLVLWHMSAAVWRSAFVAVVFSIHPLHVESVAWIAERKDVLSGLFFVMTLGAYVRHVRSFELPGKVGAQDIKAAVSRPFKSGWYWLALLLFALGLMSKPMLVTVPFVLLLLDYWPLKRIPLLTPARGGRTSPGWQLRIALAEKLPFLVLTIVLCLITMFAQTEALNSLEQVPFSARLGNAATAYLAYLGQTAYPVGLCVLYPHPLDSPPAWQVIPSVILLGLISTAVLRARSERPYLLTGWLWYLGMLVPVIGLVQVGVQAHADRYMYLPQIGLCIAIAWWAVDWCATRQRQIAGIGIAAAILILLGICAMHQTRVWRNSETLWAQALAHTRNNHVAHLNFGMALFESGRSEEAMNHWRKADHTHPAAHQAYNNLGNSLLQKGQRIEARALYERALELDPRFPATHNHLGVLLSESGETGAALRHFQTALELDPEYADAHLNLARVLVASGRSGEGIAHYRKAISTRPDDSLAHYELGGALLRAGQAEEARHSWERAVQLRPDDAEAHTDLGSLLLQTGRGDDAIAHFRKALAINPRLPETHANLGIALSQRNRLDEAILHFQKALEIRARFPSVHFQLGMALLQQGRPGEAIVQFEQTLLEESLLTPSQILGACNSLAWVLATCPDASLRNGARAVDLAQRANQLSNGENPLLLDTLAAAFAEAGRFDEAIAAARQAVERARATDRDTLARQVQARLELYQSGKPFHQPPDSP